MIFEIKYVIVFKSWSLYIDMNVISYNYGQFKVGKPIHTLLRFIPVWFVNIEI